MPNDTDSNREPSRRSDQYMIGGRTSYEPSDKTVMIVDNIAENLLVLEEILDAEGYRVASFPSGVMAMRKVLTVRPDIILLDIMMPALNGFEMCQQLKREPHTRHIPVIFISLLDDRSSIADAFKAGADDYINKPFTPAEVVARVRTHLTLAHLQARLGDAGSETGAP